MTEQLLSDPKMMERIGKFNSVYAREKFSAAQVSKRLENIYEDVIKGIDRNSNHQA